MPSPTPARVPAHRYTDPLDRIWLTAARRVGLEVRRTPDAYASTPGDGELLLATAPHLDPDDSLAQMILHELCHSLVQGEASFEKRDWGLDNETGRDVVREEACLRLQAVLSGRHGLRRLLSPTTDFRPFYDALSDDPLTPRCDPGVALALEGLRRAERPPWAPHLANALAATRAVAAETRCFADAEGPSELGDLWALVEDAPPLHASGLPPSPIVDAGRTCGTCAWRSGAAGKCRQAGGVRVGAGLPGCEHWEGALDCRECGACCRAAYDCVQVSPRDPVRKKHPGLVMVRGPYLEIERRGDRCAALEGGSTERVGGALHAVPYTCSIYEDRPKSCRDFALGGEHCLVARRRVGMTI